MTRSSRNPNEPHAPGIKVGEQVSDLRDGTKPVPADDLDGEFDGKPDPHNSSGEPHTKT